MYINLILKESLNRYWQQFNQYYQQKYFKKTKETGKSKENTTNQ